MTAPGGRGKGAGDIPLRPGSPADLDAHRRLLAACVERGEIDVVPGGWWAQRMLEDFDWAQASRFLDGPDGPLGAVLVVDRRLDDADPDALMVRVEVAAAAPHRDRLLDWGLAAARLRGAEVAQAWWIRGTGSWLAAHGMTPVRPFWRMDRPGLEAIPAPPGPAGYRLLDDRDPVSSQTWAAAVNAAFADHWRNSPKRPETLAARHRRPARLAGLDLLLVDATGAPAAVVLSGIEDPTGDRRAQPVGMVSTVGTLPAHRRRGLASWLLAEALRRLRAAGAASSSLYVDGQNPTHAYEVYRALGYQVAVEFEVWEAALA